MLQDWFRVRGLGMLVSSPAVLHCKSVSLLRGGGVHNPGLRVCPLDLPFRFFGAWRMLLGQFESADRALAGVHDSWMRWGVRRKFRETN